MDGIVYFKKCCQYIRDDVISISYESVVYSGDMFVNCGRFVMLTKCLSETQLSDIYEDGHIKNVIILVDTLFKHKKFNITSLILRVINLSIGLATDSGDVKCAEMDDICACIRQIIGV